MQNIVYQDILLKIIKEVNEINYLILTKKASSIIDVKRNFLKLKRDVETLIPKDLTITHENYEVNAQKELLDEIEKLYSVSLKFFKTLNWGDFAKLNNKKFPELYEMLVDKDGELLRIYDDFNGTVAVMDFHGYTQFSNDVKYNKTPLQEFGNNLPQKIEHICTLCRTIVYEIEGDALILIGPENPIFIFNAVLSIIELARQKEFNPSINPKVFHNIDIKNSMIKPFEMNAAITTGGETFINKKGNIIGTVISEASRMLKIISIKKNNRSGIIVSDKVYRRLEKFRGTESNCHLSIFDFKSSAPILIDVKGMRLNIREIYIEIKNYISENEPHTIKLIDEIKKKTTAKWFNIFICYIKLLISTVSNVRFSIKLGDEIFNQDKIKYLLNEKLGLWMQESNPDIIRDVLNLAKVLLNNIAEVRDSIAIFYDYIEENYKLIAEKLELYYLDNLRQEENRDSSFKKIVTNYNGEIRKLRTRILPRRILETVLSDVNFTNHLIETPYIGKK